MKVTTVKINRYGDNFIKKKKFHEIIANIRKLKKIEKINNIKGKEIDYYA